MKVGTKRNRDFAALEKRRREGMGLLAKGVPQAEVARIVGVSRTTVLRWERLRTEKRGAAWKQRRLGRPPKVTEAHLRKLSDRAEAGRAGARFPERPLDAAARVAQVLERECGASVHPSHLWRVRRDLGWSCRSVLGGKAAERDEEAIARWKRYTWPALKKGPERAPHHCFR